MRHESDHLHSATGSDRRASFLLGLGSLAGLTFLLLLLGTGSAGATELALSKITISAQDLKTGDALPKFTYIVNIDNSHLAGASDPMQRPSIAPTESNSPVVALGDQASPSVDLPAGRYLISIRAPGHKLWGKHVTLPRDAGAVRIAMREYPLPLGKIRVFVFNDNHWVNSAPDNGETGLAGFHVTLAEQTHSQVTVDYFNEPLCGGDCVTDADGFVEIPKLGPGTYFVAVTPPDGSDWVQTSTFTGGFEVQVGLEEGGDGAAVGLDVAGLPGEPLWVPPELRTRNWFGFVRPMDFPTPGTGTINGTARNWQGWPPFDNLIIGEDPVSNAYVALSSATSDDQAFTGQADADGNFSIQNIPPGDYFLSIWDEQLSYIIRFLNVSVGEGETLDLGEVGVSRWFGWLSGDVYLDQNANQVRDAGEPGIPNTDVDLRWRDGSIMEATFTDGAGHYEYPQAEGGFLGKWIIGEQGFSRLGVTGASVHDELNPAIVTPVATALGGALLTNQLVTEGHRAQVDWGKINYPANEVGQIVGITEWATTRNELDARMQLTEDYEPAIPDVVVTLEGLGPDGTPNTADDPVLNDYSSDHWQAPTDCAFTDAAGNPIDGMNPLIGSHCLEVPINGVQTKDGAFDGGYAFADMCAPDPDTGASTFPCPDDMKVPLVAGTYVVQVHMPEDVQGNALYHIVREEDVNVDLGAEFTPAIPPPPCVGDMHIVDPETTTPRSPYAGTSRPLCDKKLVVLQNAQNANADFYLMTNFPNGTDVQIPGRIFGLVSDNIYFDNDKQSIWYGEAKPIANIPIGIRDYKGRLLTTIRSDVNGEYEALLPSTETLNCPIPQGPCPGMYIVVVNDPGDKDSPNLNYNPNYLTAPVAWDVWPGLTTQIDVPLDPISGTACELPANTPELLQVSRPYVRWTEPRTERRVTIQGDFFGSATGRVELYDQSGVERRQLTVANGGILGWSNRAIEIRLLPGLAAAPYELRIRTAAGSVTTNGITLHYVGPGYNPPIVEVAAPTASPHAIQNAIDAAPRDSLLVLKSGTYHENVIMWKRLKLQGLGPGGLVGASELQQRQPEDPRFDIPGSVIDGRFFQDNKADWKSKIAALGPLAGVDARHPVLEGADITVVAQNRPAFAQGGIYAARIDGIGLRTGQGEGAGGIHLQAWATNLQITNDVLESNGGTFAGGIGIGQPYFDAHNWNVKVAFNRVLGNGGFTRSGGIGIFRGSNGYEVANSIFCANFGVEYGAGISHWGLSPGGSIHDNQIYYNDSVDSGAGIAISQETPQPVNGRRVLGDSSGAVDIDRNLIQSNFSNDDGGGIFIQNAMKDRINIRNNMIVDNGAAHIGGAIMLDDSSNVAIVNNTIQNNVSTGSSEGSDDLPHSAGLASEANDPLFQATLPGTAPRFSNPVALFNNIIWQNEAFTLSSHAPGATLESHGFMDFEIVGTTGSFAPVYSILTSGPAGVGNRIGQDPLAVEPFTLQLTVLGSRLDPQFAAVKITGQDPPVGLTGNYHSQTTSPAINNGIVGVAGIFAPRIDYDRQNRPLGGRFDIGADEVR
jgi:polysaccharide lyase family 4-like protein/copper-binding protein NosD